MQHLAPGERVGTALANTPRSFVSLTPPGRKRVPSATRRRTPIDASSQELRNPDGSDTVFGFQCNERYLDWDESATRQLLRIYAAEQLGTDLEDINQRLLELAAIFPDMVNKLERLKAGLVVSLLRNTRAVAHRMIALTEALPGINVSEMVSGNLWLLQEPPTDVLAEQLQSLRDALPGVSVERVVESEPRLLLTDIHAVKAELQRLMPGSDPAQLVATHAGMVLGMKDAGMPASLLIDDGIDAE